LARPGKLVAVRQLHLVADALLRLGYRRAKIAATHAVLQRNEALIVLAVDVGRAGLQPHVAKLAKRDIGGRRLPIAVGEGNRNGTDNVDIATIIFCKPPRERQDHLAVIKSPGLPPPHPPPPPPPSISPPQHPPP